MCVCVHVHVRVCVHVCMCVCMCVCVCVLYNNQSAGDQCHHIWTLVDHTHQNVVVGHWDHYIQRHTLDLASVPGLPRVCALHAPQIKKHINREGWPGTEATIDIADDIAPNKE